jgi:hypothetical protein
MSDDYLWDKSGEADPEVEHLERVLGDLRYRRPDVPPAFSQAVPAARPRHFSPLMAMAAAFVFLALALGVWLGIRQHNNGKMMLMPVLSLNLNEIHLSKYLQDAGRQLKPDPKADQWSNPVIALAQRKQPRIRNASQVAQKRSGATTENPQTLSRAERAEALRAKDQLMKAVEITSARLNFVQRKVRGDKGAGPES